MAQQLTFDVSPLVPEAQPIALAAARIYWEHTRPWFVGLLAHGSALKGGFIPGCSDIDLQLYLRDDVLDAAGNLPMAVGLAIQRELSSIDPTPFLYIQCYSHRTYLIHGEGAERTGHTIGPVPGTYHMIAGTLPIPEATREELIERASFRLSKLEVYPPTYITANLLEHGGGRLERITRLLCTDVWPALFQVLVLRTGEPFDIWRLPKDRAIGLLPESDRLGVLIRRFYDAVRAHYAATHTTESALAVIVAGVDFLLAAREWYDGAAPTSPEHPA